MTIQDRSIATDQRFAFEVNGLDAVQATLSKTPSNAPVNLYWDGQASLTELIDFFGKNYPHSASSSFRALVWKDNDRSADLLIDVPQAFQAFVKLIPDDAQFVRIEHTDGNKQSVSPDFVVWSRLDAPVKPINMMGVSGDFRQLARIADQVATLISDTHSKAVVRETALDGVRQLLGHFIPA